MDNETINLTTLICDTINSIFVKFFSSIDNSIYSNLDNLFFIKSNICDNPNFEKIFGSDSTNGLLLLANSFILGILIFYLINFALSHLTYSKIDSPYQFILKSILFITFANSALWICKHFINLFSLVTDFIMELGFIINGFEINFSVLIEYFNNTIYPDSFAFDIFSINGIFKVLFSLEIIYIFILYTIRFIMCKILILISPFAFISLINNKTDGFFKGWLYYFLSLLFTQILVAITLVLAFSLDIYYENLSSKFMFFALIAIIAKCQHSSFNTLKFIYKYSKNSLKEKFD